MIKLLSVFILMIMVAATEAKTNFLEVCEDTQLQSDAFKNDLAWLKHLIRSDDCKIIYKHLGTLKSLTEIIPVKNKFYAPEKNSWTDEFPHLYGIFENTIPEVHDRILDRFKDVSIFSEFDNLEHLVFMYHYEYSTSYSLCELLDMFPSTKVVTVSHLNLTEKEDFCLLQAGVEGIIIRDEFSEISEKLPETPIIGIEKYSGPLSELKRFPDLKYLGLSSPTIKENGIETLGGLLNLMHLSLRITNLKNLTFIKYFDNLSTLKISCKLREEIGAANDCSQEVDLGDLTFLKDLLYIKKLHLSDLNIKEIGHIQDLKHLNKLVLTGNKLKSIESIMTLKKLTYLDLSGNEISDIGPLKSIPNLNFLNISNNKITDYSSISQLPNLHFLNISNNVPTNDLSSLRPTSKLKVLSLNGKCQDNTSIELFGRDATDQISNINKNERILFREALKKDFNVSGETILFDGMGSEKTWKALKEMKCVMKPFLAPTTDLSHLKDLEVLSLRHNSLVTIPNLTNLRELKYLDLEGNEIKSIKNLPAEKLEALDMSFNQLVTFPNLKDFKKMTKLDLLGNNIRNISNLEKLANSKLTMELSGNLIKNPKILYRKKYGQMDITMMGNPIHKSYCKLVLPEQIPAIEELCGYRID